MKKSLSSIRRRALVILALIGISHQAKPAFTLTPQTPAAVLGSYTQAINTAGLLDYTFGNQGVVTTLGTGEGNGNTNALLLQPDGKLVGVGSNGTIFQLIRYNSDGSIDDTFNGGVPVTTPDTVAAYAALLQSDGKIVAVGYNGGPNFCLVRYNSDGSIDHTFNGGEPVTTTGTNNAYGAVLQPDGKIVAVGYNGGLNFCLVRYNSDGLIDDTFNGGAPVTTPGTGGAYAAVLQPDGKIIAVGQNAAPNFCLVRYNSDGLIDDTFNGGAPVTTPGTNIAYAVVLQPDGKIIAVGRNATPNFCLVRYNSDGSIDDTFNGGAPVTTPGTTIAQAAVLQADGKIIAVGGNPGSTAFCLVRYNADGSIDTTFGSNGINIVTGGNAGAYPQAVVLQPDGKIVAGGESTGVAFDCILNRYINPFSLQSFNASYGGVGML